MMSKTAQALLAVVCSLAAGAARADVIYTFTGTGPSPGSYGGIPFTPTLDITLDVTNAAVARGSFTLSGSESNSQDASQDYTGDLADWISLSATSLPRVGPGVIPTLGQFRLALTFDPGTAAVTSTNFEAAFDATGETTLAGTGSSASGTVSSDYPPYALCDPRDNTCNVSGSWTETSTSPGAVPEPATFAVLGVGLLGMAGLRRQFITDSTGEA